MKDKKLPETSIEAYKMLPDEMKERHHSKILEALKELKLATYEEISLKVGMDKHQVGRRISELEREQLIYKPGSKKNTSTGRSAFQYSLTTNNTNNIINMSFINKEGKQAELF